MPNTIIDRFFDYVVDGDSDDAIKLTTDDVTFELQGPSNVPIDGKFHGHDGARKFINTLRELFDTEAFEVPSTLGKVEQTGRLFQSEWALYFILIDE